METRSARLPDSSSVRKPHIHRPSVSNRSGLLPRSFPVSPVRYPLALGRVDRVETGLPVLAGQVVSDGLEVSEQLPLQLGGPHRFGLDPVRLLFGVRFQVIEFAAFVLEGVNQLPA